MNNIFDLGRFSQLLKADLLMRKSAIITTVITILGILLLYNFIFPSNIMTVDSHPLGFLFLLFFGGIYISSFGFQDFQNKQNNYFYLTLPCSNFEKLLSRLLLTSIVYAVAILLIYTFFYWTIATVTLIFFKSNHFVLLPFLSSTWRTIWLYTIIQSIFLLGSVYFKRLALIRTILVITGIAIILFLISSRVLLSGFFMNPAFFVANATSTGGLVLNIAHTIFGALLAPFCWVVAYFRLKEVEV